jgi:hypothetical protein
MPPLPELGGGVAMAAKKNDRECALVSSGERKRVVRGPA